MEIKKIVFYYPSRITGGAEYLFKRCAEYLAENQNKFEIIYVDFADGFAKKNILSSKIRFVEYTPNMVYNVEDGSAIIAQLNIVYQLPQMFRFNAQKSLFLFWCLHTRNITIELQKYGIWLVSKGIRKKIGCAVERLSDMGVVKYMSYIGCFEVFKDLYIEPKEYAWLPNVIQINNNEKPLFLLPGNEKFKFCWLGRLDKEKSRNIITYMNELENISKDNNITFSLIGRGPCESMLKKIAAKYSYPILFLGEKRDSALDDYIVNHTDIGLASGTSALEFSLRGKPVIIDGVLDKVYTFGERKKYIFTHENELIDYSYKTELVRLKEATFYSKFIEIKSNYLQVASADYNYAATKTAKCCCNKLIESINVIERTPVEIIQAEITKINGLIKPVMTFRGEVHKIKQLLMKCLKLV